MLNRRILILALLTIGFMASGASLDINDSDPLQYYSDGDIDFEVYSNGTANIDQNLAMGDGSNISNYFDGPCGEFRAVKGINPNGTWVCTEEILEEKTEYLNETLAAGNKAERSINMTQDNIDNIADLNSNGTDLNISGDVNFEEKNIENVEAIQDGGETDSILLNEDNTVDIENGNLLLSQNSITEVNDLNFNGGDDSVSQIKLPNTGAGDRIEFQDTDGTGTQVRLRDDGRVEILQNDLNVSGNRINGSAGDIDFSGSTLGINAVTSANQRLDIASSLRVEDGNKVNFGTNDDLSARYDSGNSQVIFDDESSGNDLLRIQEDGKIDVPSGNLIMQDNNISQISRLSDVSTDINLDASTASYGQDNLVTTTSNNAIIGIDEVEDGSGAFKVVKGLSGVSDGTSTVLVNVDNSGNLNVTDGNISVAGENIKEISNLYEDAGNSNFFQNKCSAGSVIAGINADGSYNCASSSSQVTDIWVNESGDTMTGTLNMTGDQIIEIGTERSNFTNSGGLDLGDRLDAGNNDIQNAPQIQNTDSIDLDIDSDANSNSQSLEITRDGESQILARFNENGQVEIQDGNLNLEENSVENVSAIYDNESTANFFQNECSPGSLIKGINADGTYDCASSSAQVTDIWVNETGDNMTGNLDMNDNDIIEVDELRTDGTGSDVISVRDVDAGNNLTQFREGGTLTVPNGKVQANGSSPVFVTTPDSNTIDNGFIVRNAAGNKLGQFVADGNGQDVLFENKQGGKFSIGLAGTGSREFVMKNGGPTTFDTDGTRALRIDSSQNVNVTNGDLDLQNNNVDDVASIDGGGDEIRADDGINMNQNNVSDVKKVGFGDGSKIKSNGGRMCIGNRCS